MIDLSKKLFKCYQTKWIDSLNQIRIIWVRDKKEAIDKCIDHVIKEDIYYNPEETVVNDWKFEELHPPSNHHIIVAYDKELDSIDGCHIVYVPYSEKEVNEFVYDELGIRLSKEEHFPFAISTLFESFAPYDEDKCYFIFNEHFKQNVREFFKGEPKMAEQYLDYVFANDNEEYLNDDFYIYVGKKLARDTSYINYSFEKVVEPDGI